MQRILPKWHFSVLLSNSSTSTVTFSLPPEGANFSQSVFPSRSVNQFECSLNAVQCPVDPLPAGILKQQDGVGSDLMLKALSQFHASTLRNPAVKFYESQTTTNGTFPKWYSSNLSWKDSKFSQVIASAF